MKKLGLLFGFVLLWMSIQAQQFIQYSADGSRIRNATYQEAETHPVGNGAKSDLPRWTYWVIDPMAPQYVPATYSLHADTVVQGVTYRKSDFYLTASDGTFTTLLLQEDSSGMYYYDPILQEKRTLYPYFAGVGYQYTIYPIMGDTTYRMVVHIDSVTHENIDNQNLKVIYVSTQSIALQEPYLDWTFDISDISGGHHHAKIIEHIGSIGFLLPQETAYNDNFVKNLCSYEGEELSYQLVDSINCNEPYYYSVPQHLTPVMRVWPNPTDDLLHVELTSGAGIMSIVLYDLRGRVVTGVYDTPLQMATATLTVKSVPAGVYLLRVRDVEGKEYHRKIVRK